MTIERKSQLASEISQHRVTYDNLKLVAFKAWESGNWEQMGTCADNLQFLDQTIKAKLAEINRLNHVENLESLEVIL